MPRDSLPPEERIRRNVTSAGRPRNTDEQLLTASLVEQLDREQQRRGLDQRAMADVLGVHESLLSLYRSGQRLPSLSGCLQIEKSFPGFLLRLVQGYYRHVRQRDMAARGFEDHDGRELEGPPAQRVGPHMMDELLLV